MLTKLTPGVYDVPGSTYYMKVVVVYNDDGTTVRFKAGFVDKKNINRVFSITNYDLTYERMFNWVELKKGMTEEIFKNEPATIFSTI